MKDSREELFRDLERYIAENWIPPEESQEEPVKKRKKDEPADSDHKDLKKGGTPENPFSAMSLDNLIEEVGKSFHEVLFEKAAESGMTDVEIYKRANMDRKLFSKIRSNPAYHPRKDTVLALAIALRLSMDETEDLLARAEYALSPGSKSDVIIRYFIEKKIYDIDTINIALYEHGLPVLQ